MKFVQKLLLKYCKKIKEKAAVFERRLNLEWTCKVAAIICLGAKLPYYNTTKFNEFWFDAITRDDELHSKYFMQSGL